jgi:hypothetical protein
MWIVQNDVMMEVPDDVPLPPNSKRIDVPAEFLASPRDFRLHEGALLHEPRKVEPPPKLTRDEIVLLKQLVAKEKK